jgi:hypothetical protein
MVGHLDKNHAAFCIHEISILRQGIDFITGFTNCLITFSYKPSACSFFVYKIIYVL